jgi:serine/threonine protein kinase
MTTLARASLALVAAVSARMATEVSEWPDSPVGLRSLHQDVDSEMCGEDELAALRLPSPERHPGGRVQTSFVQAETGKECPAEPRVCRRTTGCVPLKDLRDKFSCDGDCGDLAGTSFDSFKLLGSGTYGCVYRVPLPGGGTGAVKVQRYDKYPDERENMRSIKSGNVMPVLGWIRYSPKEDEVLLMQLAMGDLLTFKRYHKWGAEAKTEGVKLKLLRDVLQGCADLHAAGHVHGDLKPGNVLVFDAPKGDALALPTAKLADLGAMRKKDQLTQSALYKGGKLVFEAFPNQFSTYQPPEFFPVRTDKIENRVLIVNTDADPLVPARDYPTEAHDVWAAGLCGWLLFVDGSGFGNVRVRPPLEQVALLLQERRTPKPILGPIADLLSGLLAKDPEQRLSAARGVEMIDAILTASPAKAPAPAPAGYASRP